MQPSTKFEQSIQYAVEKKVENIYPSEKMFDEIKMKIRMEREGEKVMKIKSVKKSRGLLAACLLLALTTVTCFAAIHISSYEGHSQNIFSKYPDQKAMEKAAGFSPKYIEGFANGYEFKMAGTGETTANDEAGNAVATVKTANVTYSKGGSLVSLIVQDGVLEEGEDEFGVPVTLAGNVKGQYSEYQNKVVPPDYQMTEDDKKAEKEGKYIFSFGSEKVEINHVQSITWTENGQSYYIGCYDDGVDKEGLIEMANELIMK